MDIKDLSKTIDMAKQGDRKAFGALYAQHYDAVYRFVLKKVGNKEAAEDLTQDIFMQSFENLGSLDEPKKYLSWLYGIAEHKCADHFRLQNKAPTVGEDAASAELAAFVDDKIMLPDDYCVSAERTYKLRKIIDSLKPDMKKALLLYYYDGLSISKVAKKLGVSENAVKQKLYRARKRLGCEIKKLEKNGAAFTLVPMRELVHFTLDESAAAKPRRIMSAQAKAAVAGAAACTLAVGIPVGLHFTEYRFIERDNNSIMIYNDSSTADDSSDIQYIKIPNLVNCSPEEAQQRLADIGLKSEIRKTEQFFPLGKIPFTAPFGGYEVPYGDTVILYECVNNYDIDEELLSRSEDLIPENYYDPGEYFFKTYETDTIPEYISDTEPPYNKIFFDIHVTDELISFGECSMKIRYDGKTDDKYADIVYDFSDHEDNFYIVLWLEAAPQIAEIRFEALDSDDVLEYGTYYFDYDNNVAYLCRSDHDSR